MSKVNFNNLKVNKMLRRTMILGLSFAMVSLTACNDEDDSNLDLKQGPLYGIMTAVENPDGRANYLHTVDELGPSVKFDPTVSLELPGYSRMWAKENSGEFLIGQSEDVTITKWQISEGEVFEKGSVVSLQGEGTDYITQTMTIVSETKAYYIDFTQGQLIVINPEGMIIEKVIPLPAQMAPEVDGLFTDFSSTSPYQIINDKLFIPVGWTDYDTKMKQATGLAVVDVNTDEITYTEDDRAPSAISTVKMDNGDLYFGTGWTIIYDAEGRELNRKGGILRVKAGETTFDPNYYVPYPEFAADIFQSPVDNRAYIRVLDETKLKWSEVQDASETFSNVWQPSLIDVTTGEIEVVESLPHVVWFRTKTTDGRIFTETQERIEEEPQNNRIVKLEEASADGKSFQKVYECDRCRFIQEIVRLK